MWLKLGLWALRNWKAIALVLLIGLAAGWIYHKGSEAAQARADAQQAKEREAALTEHLADANAALEAAQVARGRNDEVIPEARRRSADRIGRADSADAEQRLRDDQAAQAEYAEAAGIVRGKGAR